MEKVSIIIATHNREKFVTKAIKSALTQTYPKVEVIVVDDNSDYEIHEVLKDFEDKITIIKNKRNMGVSATRNIGVKESSGKYVTFLDDDDLFHPKKIERQIKIFNKKPNVGLVYCPVARKINNVLFYKPLKKEKNYYIRLTHQNSIGATPLIKNECLSVCGVFDESLCYHEDRDLWYRIGKKFQFDFDKDPSYIVYNLNIHRLSSQLKKIYSGKKILYEKHKNDFKDKNLYFSDLHYELSQVFLQFQHYITFLHHFKISFELNPKILLHYLFDFIELPLNKINLSRIKVDKEYKEIFKQ